MNEADLIDRYIDDLKRDPKASPPAGLDAKTAVLLQSLVIGQHQSIDEGLQKRLWRRSLLMAETGLKPLNQTIYSSNHQNHMEDRDMFLNPTYKSSESVIPSKPKNSPYYLIFAAALAMLVLVGSLLIRMASNRDNTSSPGISSPIKGTNGECDTEADYESEGARRFDEGDYQGSFDAYHCAVLLDPYSAKAYLGRGKAAVILGQYVRATDDYGRVRAAARGLLDQAAESYSAAIEKNPADVIPYKLQAFIYWLTIQDEKAQYDRVIELAPEDPFGYLFKGSTNQYWGNTDITKENFAKALELAAENSDVYSIIAETYAETGVYDLALENVDRAIELAPESAFVYLLRANTYDNMSDPTSALKDYLRYIDLIAVEKSEVRPIEPGQFISVGMTTGRVYQFTFDAKAAQILTISAGSASSTVDTLVMLLGSDGQPVAASDDLEYLRNMASTISNFTIQVDGTYTLLVTHSAHIGSGRDGEVGVSLEVKDG